MENSSFYKKHQEVMKTSLLILSILSFSFGGSWVFFSWYYSDRLNNCENELEDLQNKTEGLFEPQLFFKDTITTTEHVFVGETNHLIKIDKRFYLQGRHKFYLDYYNLNSKMIKIGNGILLKENQVYDCTLDSVDYIAKFKIVVDSPIAVEASFYKLNPIYEVELLR